MDGLQSPFREETDHLTDTTGRSLMTLSSRANLWRGAVVSCAVVLSVSACTGTQPQPAPSSAAPANVSIVSATSMVPNVIAELYGEALRNAGHNVTVPADTAPAATVVAASKAVESTGNTLAIIPLPTASTIPLVPTTSSPSPTPSALKSIESFALNPTKANDRQVVAMTAARAQETAVKSLDFASPKCASLGAAMSAPLDVAEEFKKELADKYSCRVQNVNSLDSRRQLLSALLTDQIQLAVLPQTDPSIYDNGLVVLDDPRNLFPNQTVTPYLSGDLQNTDVAAIANKVSEKITETTLADLTRATTGDGALSAKDAAREWLVDQGLMTAEQK